MPVASITTSEFKGDNLSVKMFGAVGDGVANDTDPFVAALAYLDGISGGSLHVPVGNYLIGDIDIPANVLMYGDGVRSQLKRIGTLPTGRGILNIAHEGSALADLCIEGNVLTSVGLAYSSFGGDPMHSSLTTNTSIWIHGGAKRVWIDGITIRHTGGYSILIDATTGDVDTITITKSLLENNRPHTFGVGTNIYGSWTGGVHYQGNGTSYALNNLLVDDCTFRRNTGNCVWGHLYAFSKLHSNIRVTHCHFIDCGLDGVLMGGVLNGTVSDCDFRRIGYVCADDTSPSVPLHLNGANATALDTSGLVLGVSYANNSFVSVFGGCMDLDGFGDGTVIGNICRHPESGSTEYSEDSIGSWASNVVTYGVQLSNSSNQPRAGQGVVIKGNKFYNMTAGSIRLYASRGALVSDNIIEATPSNIFPIYVGNIGSGTYQRATGNVIIDNSISYSPSSEKPAIFEDGAISAFTSAEKNWVSRNRVTGNGNGYEFQKDANTTSSTDITLSSNSSSLVTKSQSLIRREGVGNTAVLRFYKETSGGSALLVSILDVITNGTSPVGGPLLNVSHNGDAGSGSISTAGRTVLPFDDLVAAGAVYADNFLILTDTTFSTTKANLLDDSYGLLWYNSTSKKFEKSVSTLSGARVWTDLVPPGGSDKHIQFNDSGVFAGSSNLTFDKVTQLVTINGISGTPGLAVAGGYIQADQGFYVPALTGTSYQSIQALGGGVNARSLRAEKYTQVGSSLTPPTMTAGDVIQSGAMFWDLTNTTLKVWNGAAWVPVGGSTSPGGGDTYVQYNSSGSFAGSSTLTWNNGIGELALVGYVTASIGFHSANTATDTIQAPNGGITSKWGIFTNSMFLIEQTAPPLSGAGQARMYADLSSHKIMVSINGGAYVNLLPTPAGSDQYVQYNSSGVFGASANFRWNNSASTLDVTGVVNATTGFVSTNTAQTTIQAPVGGVTGKWLIATESLFFIETTAPGVSATGQSKMYMDSSDHKLRVSVNGGAFSLFNAPAGSDQQVQYNSSGSFAGSSSFTWNNGAATLNVTGVMNATTGFLSSNTAQTTIQAPNGGVTAAWLIATDSLFLIERTAPSVSGAGQIRVYADSSTHRIKVSANGGGYADIGGAPGGSDTHVQYNSSGSFAGSSRLTWNNTTGELALTGYVTASVGFHTPNTATDVLQAPNGGVTAKWLIATDSFFLIEESTPALSASGQVRIYANSSDHNIYVSKNGGSYSVFGNPAGSNTYIQYNSLGSFGASSLFTWDNPNRLLTVTGNSGFAGIAVANGYIQSDGGFLVTSTNTQWNSIQSSGGLKVGGAIQMGDSFTSDQSSAANKWFCHMRGTGIPAFIIDSFPDGGGTSIPAFIGRKARGSSSFMTAVVSGDTLFTVGGRGSYGNIYTSSASAAVSFAASESWSSFGVGAEILFQTVTNGGNEFTRTTKMWVRNDGLIEMVGRSGANGTQLNNGWYAANDSTNGGFHASGNQYNVFQAPSGGVYVGLGVTTDQALYPKTLASSPNTPGGGYAGFGHRSGSTFWYYNPSTSSWGFVDFASSGSGVTSIQASGFGSLTGSVTLQAGSNVAITQSGSTITIAATTGGGGVTSLNSFTGTVNILAGSNISVSNSGGNITIAVTGAPNPFNQTLNTTNSVTFNALTVTNQIQINYSGIGYGLYLPNSYVFANGLNSFNTQWNSIQAPSGGIASSLGYYMISGSKVITSGGVFCGSGILMNQGCGATGFSFFVSSGGSFWTYRAGGTGSFTDTFGNTYTFEGGIITKINGSAYNQFNVTAPF